MSEEVSLEAVGNDVFEIRLQRPERMNALGVATCAALERAVSDAAQKRARVVLIRGSGRAFCAGADLKERKGMDLAARLAHNAAIRAAIDSVASARFVTIAVLNGVALGGGLELALGCDLRFAAAGVTLGLTESRVGAFPGAGGTQRLPRLVGVSRALQMMLSGEPVSSEYALTIGLVNEVIAADDLDTRVRAFAKTPGERVCARARGDQAPRLRGHRVAAGSGSASRARRAAGDSRVTGLFRRAGGIRGTPAAAIHGGRAMSSRPPAGYLSKARQVAQELLSRIADSKVEPGQTFATEAELLQQFDVSRPTLREGIRILESQGVLEQRPGPGGGLVVRRPSLDCWRTACPYTCASTTCRS